MNQRAWHGKVDPKEQGLRLDDWLAKKARLTKSAILRAFKEKRVLYSGEFAQPDWRTKVGQSYQIIEPKSFAAASAQAGGKSNPNSPNDKASVKPNLEIVYVDKDIVIVNKPPGLTTSRNARDLKEFGPKAKQFLPPTLADWLPKFLPKIQRVFPVHRIDRETSGVLVFALNEKAAATLARLFKKHELERSYLALTRNTPPEGWIRNDLVRDRGDGRRGSGSPGEPAITMVQVVEAFSWGALVRCTLETGRTHQVRIHLAECGAPLCGEKVYDRPLHGKPFKDPSEAPRIMLHANVLAFNHPVTGKPVRFEVDPPTDFHRVLKKMRDGSKRGGKPA